MGLGLFCKKYGCDPSSLEGQTSYMINENQFQKVLPDLQRWWTNRQSIHGPFLSLVRMGDQRSQRDLCIRLHKTNGTGMINTIKRHLKTFLQNLGLQKQLLMMRLNVQLTRTL